MPGAIADLTGSYAPAYIVFTLFAIFTLAVVQSTYRLERRSAVCVLCVFVEREVFHEYLYQLRP